MNRWKPFINSFNNSDDKEFKEVHSPDVIRVIQDNNQILGFGDYFRKTPDSLKTKWAAWKKNIELRFIQRIVANGKAFEVGYYKTTNSNSSSGRKGPVMENFMCCYAKKMVHGKY